MQGRKGLRKPEVDVIDLINGKRTKIEANGILVSLGVSITLFHFCSRNFEYMKHMGVRLDKVSSDFRQLKLVACQITLFPL